jgi:hypothetical protein
VFALFCASFLAWVTRGGAPGRLLAGAAANTEIACVYSRTMLKATGNFLQRDENTTDTCEFQLIISRTCQFNGIAKGNSPSVQSAFVTNLLICNN